MNKRATVLGRILSKVTIQPNGCWQHRSGRDGNYIQVRSGMAHRIVYEHFHGAIPEGKILDHACHDPKTCLGGVACQHRRCVNPAHMAVTDHAGNLAPDRRVPKPKQAQCRRGHALTAANIIIKKTTGGRSCRECYNAYIRAWKLRKKALLREA